MSVARDLTERAMVRCLSTAEINQVCGGETEGGCIDPNPFPPTMQEMIDGVLNPKSLEDLILGR